jgi:hypothetical protein
MWPIKILGLPNITLRKPLATSNSIQFSEKDLEKNKNIKGLSVD